MLHTMVMPKLGLTMEEGQITRWMREEGEGVMKGEPLLVVETEKISYEIEAPDDGILHIVKPEGETVAVGDVIAVVAETPEAYARAVQGAPAIPAAVAAGAGPTSLAPAPEERETIRASPLARKLAAEAGVDLQALKGTGPGGRITREDVDAAVAARGAQEPPVGRGEVRRLTPMRRTIAARLGQSLREMAQVTVMAEVDMSALSAFREELNRGAGGESGRITFTDLFVKLVAQGLRAHPLLNATLRGDELHLLEEYHIGVAVELDDGLVVPVIREVDRKPLRVVSRELADLTARARARQLKPEEMEGGTFTVSNAGMFGVDAVTPIINPPEVGILGVGRIAPRPLAVDAHVEVRPAATLCLTFDHRVVDGAPASRFLAEMRRLVEAPRAALAGQVE